MKKAMMFACVLGFGLFIGSCKGNFGDLFGSDNDGSDSTRCPHHHGGNDHDADDTVIVPVDTTASNYIILHSH